VTQRASLVAFRPGPRSGRRASSSPTIRSSRAGVG